MLCEIIMHLDVRKCTDLKRNFHMAGLKSKAIVLLASTGICSFLDVLVLMTVGTDFITNLLVL